MSADEGYLLANEQRQAGSRFDALSTLFDPSTFRHLRELGLSAGQRCWEVGAGGPSVPRWLAEQVGATGVVVATDIDTTWLDTTRIDDADGSPLRVLRHDVGAEPPPLTGLDIVHARLVLIHVPNRQAALAHMVSALRPGGWLLIEDADPALLPLICPDEYGPEQQLANRLRTGFRTLLTGRSADMAYGRTLPRLLREQGLVDVGADAWFPISAPALAALESATIEQVRDRLVEAGIATAAEIDEHLANIDAGRLPDLATAPMVSAWGRRPDVSL